MLATPKVVEECWDRCDPASLARQTSLFVVPGSTDSNPYDWEARLQPPGIERAVSFHLSFRRWPVLLSSFRSAKLKVRIERRPRLRSCGETPFGNVVRILGIVKNLAANPSGSLCRFHEERGEKQEPALHSVEGLAPALRGRYVAGNVHGSILGWGWGPSHPADSVICIRMFL